MRVGYVGGCREGWGRFSAGGWVDLMIAGLDRANMSLYHRQAADNRPPGTTHTHTATA